MQGDVIEELARRYEKLTKSEKKVADYVFAHHRNPQFMSITSLAEECRVAEATIFRFCKTLGFKGYNEFKLALAKAQGQAGGSQPGGAYGAVGPGDAMEEVYQKVYSSHMEVLEQTLATLRPGEVEKASALLLAADRVFCFGQGGSLILAMEAWARFSTIAPNFYCIEDAHMQAIAAALLTGRDVVLVTPTYAWRIPRVVSGWLGKTALTGAERIWFVMDCGSEIGNAAGYNRQLAAQKQLQYMGTAQIIMPENYIAMFNAPQKEQAKSIVEQAEPALQKVLTRLRAGQEFPPPRENLYDRFMSGPVNPVFYRFFVKADAFRATDACIGCGKCVELCPLNNIYLENGRPVWGKNCTHCMACICYCPKEAIEYGKKSKGKPRYHFEALEKQQDV